MQYSSSKIIKIAKDQLLEELKKSKSGFFVTILERENGYNWLGQMI